MNLNNLREINMVAVLERANFLLEHLLMLGITNENMMQVALDQAETDETDVWESCAWRIVRLEICGRQIRQEDPSCETNSPHESFNGGFTTQSNYLKVVDALSDHLAKIELSCAGTNEAIEPKNINADYILDRIGAESDLLELIAQRVRLALTTSKN
jgi:hypothetical protein